MRPKKTELPDINEKMLRELNEKLEEMGCSFRYRHNKSLLGVFVIERVIANDKFVDSAIINTTSEFTLFLEDFFKQRGINSLVFSGNSCWAAHSI